MRETTMKIKDVEVNWHRNGGGGEGFYTGFFDWMNDKKEWQKMFYVIYDRDGYCSILDARLLTKGDVVFMSNSWRGDHFEPELRRAIKKHEEKKYGKDS